MGTSTNAYTPVSAGGSMARPEAGGLKGEAAAAAGGARTAVG